MNKKYVDVILPIKFREAVTYSVPDSLITEATIGSRVEIFFGNNSYKAIIIRENVTPLYDIRRIKDIICVDDVPKVDIRRIHFWEAIANYYMCSIGEVLKASPGYLMDIHTTSKREIPTEDSSTPKLHLSTLTNEQQDVLEQIKNLFSQKKRVLLSGTSCTGKREVLSHLIYQSSQGGKNVLVLAPDLPALKLLEKRLNKIFKGRLITYHSKLTEAKKRHIVETLRENHQIEQPDSLGQIIIGLRSSLFLPIENLGLIVVTDEHDPSYKQYDPAPRYCGRDTALFLSQAYNTDIILSSATPSFESLYNVKFGKYNEVRLSTIHSSCHEAEVVIIDTKKESRKNAMKGLFSLTAIKAINEAISLNKEIAIFTPKRSHTNIETLSIEIAELFHDYGIGVFDDIALLESKRVKPTFLLLLQGENMLNSQDFRADEKCIRALERLRGIIRRGKTEGQLFIQTALPAHPIFKKLFCGDVNALMEERRQFGFPPYTRFIQITIKDRYESRAARSAEALTRILKGVGVDNIVGPIAPPFEKSTKRHSLIFRIMLKRDKSLSTIKRKMVEAPRNGIDNQSDIIIDVDPV